MLNTKFSHHECPIAQALREIGDGWTLLIIREAMYGTSQFEGFRRNIGAPRAVLSNRLAQLTANNILKRTRSEADKRKTFYELTGKGRDLWTVLLSLLLWSEKHLAQGGIVSACNSRTGAVISDISAIDQEGNAVAPDETVLVPGERISDEFRARIEAAFNR